MELEEWTNKSCTAQIGVGDDWATIYLIESKEKNKGHAEELLKYLKMIYKDRGKTFGSSVALSGPMRHLLKKLNIKEYQ